MSISKNSYQELSHHRNHLGLRLLLAIGGGYLLTTLMGIFLSYSLEISDNNSIVAALLLSFAIFTTAIIWVFSVKSLRQAWLGLVMPGLALEVLILTIELAKFW